MRKANFLISIIFIIYLLVPPVPAYNTYLKLKGNTNKYQLDAPGRINSSDNNIPVIVYLKK
ncbi:MAG: hypothetical protein V1921_07375 [Candidatus Altiarchaeota archaeon]